MKSPKCLYTIELSRGIAALVIFALHLIVFGHDKYGFSFTTGMDISYFLSAGVDLFFIISGFLMVHTTRTLQQRNPKEFLLKRFIRIYPAYWLVLICVLPVYFFKPEWAFFGATVKPSLWRSFLLLPQNGPPILAVAWTLVYEVYFYVLFAATLFLKPRTQFLLLGTFFITSILMGHFFFPANIVSTTGFFTSGFLLEFFSGMILAYSWNNFPKSKIFPILCFAVGIAFLITQPMRFISRSVNLGVPAFFMLAAMLGIEKNSLRFPHKTAHFFGRISYALYLVHVPIIAGLPKLAPYTGIHLPPVVLLAMAFILSITTAIILHHFYEIPIQKSIKKYLANRQIKLNTCQIEDY